MFDSIKFKVREYLPKSQKASRILKTLLCFLIAVALTASIFVAVQSQKRVVMVIKPAKVLEPGTRITDSDLKLEEVGEFGLPDEAMLSKEQAVGKYVKAQTTIYPTDCITPEKLTTKKTEPFIAQSSNQYKMSFTVPNLAASVASNLRAGDTIQVIYSETLTDATGMNTEYNICYPEILKNLKVIDIKDANGLTINGTQEGSSKIYTDTGFIPTVITVDVDSAQAVELYKAEQTKSIYAIFVSR